MARCDRARWSRGRLPQCAPARSCCRGASCGASRLAGLGLGRSSRPAGRLRHQGAKQTAGVLRQHGPVRDREEAELLQLAALHRRRRQDKKRRRPSTTFEQRDRHQGHLHRGRQRQRRVLRQGRATSSPPASRPAATSSCSPTGWPPGWSGSAGSRSSTRPRCPNVDANLLDPPQEPRVGHGPRVLRAVAERPDRHRLQRQGHRARSRSFDELLTRPDLKGKVTLLSEMRDTMGFMLMLDGARPGRLHRRRVRRRRSTSCRRPSTPARSARSPATSTPRTSQGQHRRLRGLVRRRDPAAVRQPDIKFVAPEEGLSLWSDNMLVPNQADAQGATPRS